MARVKRQEAEDRRQVVRLVTLSASSVLFTSCGGGGSQPQTTNASDAISSPETEGTQWVRASGASAHIHRLEEMNTEQLTALPRDKTVVIMPGAYKGEHGPYLPNVDSFRNERLARELAHAVAQRPGWQVVMFPFIPLGQGGANEFGGKASFSGTFVVRVATLRAIFMDLADHLGEQAFRWVFVVHHHGSPFHLHALDQAGDYFRDSYGGHMVNLAGLLGLEQLGAIFDQLATEAERNEDASSGHAGMRETSEALYLRPDLVNPAYKQAPPLAARTLDDLIQVATRKDWPGYVGSPRLATAALGERALKQYSARLNTLALEILDGRDYRTMPRGGDEALNSADPIAASVLGHERAFEQKQADWLKQHDRSGARLGPRQE
jgi:creatinine amidohydrolase/Fe(II)-dependent formamide hydrolase-like protein